MCVMRMPCLDKARKGMRLLTSDRSISSCTLGAALVAMLLKFTYSTVKFLALETGANIHRIYENHNSGTKKHMHSSLF